jgi:hypothetical protein
MKKVGEIEVEVVSGGKLPQRKPKESDNKLNIVLDYVTKEEDRFYDLAYKEMERNNMLGNQIYAAKAGTFQTVKYLIEELLKPE